MDYKLINKLEYPIKLQKIKKSPKKLYAIGNIELLYKDSFAIVGTRNPTEYGEKVCKDFSKEFALRDITVVSGLADGIDKIAHKTVLEYKSKTIAVIGCGFEYYLKNEDNGELFNEIIKNGGLILSEYDVTVEKSKDNFPQRNRIISALAEGVLVIEAAFRSGSSITANYAKEQGKSVFAIPGNINEKMSVGTNNLIKKGANLVTKIDDILECYPQFANKKRKTPPKNQENPKKDMIYKENFKKEWKEIINFLEMNICTIEELQIKTGKNIRILIKELSEMEIEGIIQQEIGIGYKLVK